MFKAPSIALLTFSLVANCFAITADGLEKGLRYKTLFPVKVATSDWLYNIAYEFSMKYDFNENVSYVGEDWEAVTEYCEFSPDISQEIADDSTVSVVIDWNKVVNKNGDTKAYILHLFANIESDYGQCLFPRGAYATDKQGVDLEIDETNIIPFHIENNLINF